MESKRRIVVTCGATPPWSGAWLEGAWGATPRGTPPGSPSPPSAPPPRRTTSYTSSTLPPAGLVVGWGGRIWLLLLLPLRCGGIRSRSRGEEGQARRGSGARRTLLSPDRDKSGGAARAPRRWRVAGGWRETGARREPGWEVAAWSPSFESGKPQQTKTLKVGAAPRSVRFPR